MAMVLAKSLIENKVYAPADVAKRYRALFLRGVVLGDVNEKAMKNLRTIPWATSGVPEAVDDKAAARIAPLGLFHHNNVYAVASFAKMDASITHNSHEARVGSTAVAIAVVGLAQGKLDRSNVLHRTLEWVPPSLTRAAMYKAVDMLNRSYGTPAETLRHLELLGAGDCVTYSVPAAFLAFCGTESFGDAVETAVRASDRNATISTIVGALAGTYYGSNQVRHYIANTSGLESVTRLQDLEASLLDTAPSVY